MKAKSHKKLALLVYDGVPPNIRTLWRAADACIRDNVSTALLRDLAQTITWPDTLDPLFIGVSGYMHSKEAW